MTKNNKTDWIKKSSVAVMLSASLLMLGQVGQAAAATAEETAVTKAYDLLGQSYQAGAKGPSSFDSAGYISYVLGQAGAQVDSTLSGMYKQGKSVNKDGLQPGDVVFFKSASGALNFAGIYVGNDKIVYASKGQGQVVEQDLSKVNNTYAGARRYLSSAVIEQKPQLPPKPIEDGSLDQPSWEKPTKPEKPENTKPSESKPSESGNVALADKIIKTGEKFMGTPYKFGAKYETSGMFDCSSFTQYVFKQNGVSLPRDSRQQSTVGKQVGMNDIQKGDLVFFRTSGSSSDRITHVAIYAGNNKLLHTYGSPGVTYTNFKGTSWEKRVVTIKRVL